MFKPFEKHRFWCDSCLNPWSDKIEQCIVKEFLNTIIMTFTLRSPFLPEPSMSFLQVSFDICVIIGLKNFYPYLDDCFQFEEPNLRFVCVYTWKSKIAGLTLSINYHPTTLLCSFFTNKLLTLIKKLTRQYFRGSANLWILISFQWNSKRKPLLAQVSAAKENAEIIGSFMKKS